MSGMRLLCKSSDVADSLAGSLIITFSNRGNSLQNNSEMEGVGRCSTKRWNRWFSCRGDGTATYHKSAKMLQGVRHSEYRPE
jgi:hypothetical protein